jgi:hypothetical protein
MYLSDLGRVKVVMENRPALVGKVLPLKVKQTNIAGIEVLSKQI